MPQLRQKMNLSKWLFANKQSTLVLAAIIGIGTVFLIRSFAAEDIVSYDATKPVIPQLQKINGAVKRHAANYKSTHPNRKRNGKQDTEQDQLVKDIKTRKRAMKIAIMSHPDQVAALVMPEGVKNQLPDELKADVEQTTELVGIWKTGHGHKGPDEKGPLQQIAAVTTSDGYNNYVYGNLPDINPGREVKVAGVELDHIIGSPTEESVKVKVSASPAAKPVSLRQSDPMILTAVKTNVLTQSDSIKTEIKLADATSLNALTAIDGGFDYSCGLISNGTVTCWGSGANYVRWQQPQTPTPVPYLTSATSIATGGGHACAIVSGGGVKCWGGDRKGQLGNGVSSIASAIPVDVLGLNGPATQISAYALGENTCALVGGLVKCWGDNFRGQIGNGAGGTGQFSSTAFTVPGITTAKQISSGFQTNCAVLTDGTVHCWGRVINSSAVASDLVPTAIPGINNAVEVQVGNDVACAVLTDKTVKCWGSNNNGQLGNGSYTRSDTPVLVSNVNNAISLSVGDAHVCVSTTVKTVKCWGSNSSGQLGNGNSAQYYSSSPIETVELAGVSMMSVGYRHSCAVVTAGVGKCWGSNAKNQLGDNAPTNSPVATPVIVQDTGGGAPPSPPEGQDGTWQVCDDASTNIELQCHPKVGTDNLDDNPIHPLSDAANPRKALIVPVRFTNSTEVPINSATASATSPGHPYTLDELRSLIVGPPTSAATFFTNNSSGQLNLTANILPDWISLDPAVSGSSMTDGTSCISNEALEAPIHDRIKAGTITGYTNIIYMFNGTACSGNAADALEGSNAPGLISEVHEFLQGDAKASGSRFTPDYLSSGFAHELGHNFGLGHADGQANNDYGNHYDNMGTNYDKDSHHLSSFHKWQLGWLATGPGMQYVTTKGTYSLAPIEARTGIRGIRVPTSYKDESTPPKDISKVTHALYLEYRQPGKDNVFDPLPIDGQLTSGVLINSVSALGQMGDGFSSGVSKAEQSLLTPGDSDTILHAALTLNKVYRYHLASAKNSDGSPDVTHDVCITLKAVNPDKATVDIDPGCGVIVTQQTLPINPSFYGKSMGALTTTYKNDKKNNPNTSSATCMDPVAHQLYVADSRRVLAYDLDPATNKLKDYEADHVLGADNIHNKYAYDSSLVFNIDHDIGPTNASVRWTGKINIPADGKYNFQTYSDDGVRVWLDGALAIDNWTDHLPTRNSSGELNAKAGSYDIKVEYYNHLGSATMQLQWLKPGSDWEVVPASAFGSGLKADYFSNKHLRGKILWVFGKGVVTQTDKNIDNPWGFNENARAATFADYNPNELTAKSINYDNIRLACDTKRNRLFVASTNSGTKASRVQVFDFAGGIKNGMNASYVLGQKDFNTLASSTTPTSNPTYSQANTFEKAFSIAYSAKYDTLFVGQNSDILRVLAFDLSNISNGMNATYVLGQKTGQFSKSDSGGKPSKVLGIPYSLAVDDTHDRIFIAGLNGSEGKGNHITAMNTQAGRLDGLSRLGDAMPVPTADNTKSGGPILVTADGNHLFQFQSGTSAHMNSPMSIFDVSAPTLTAGATPVSKASFLVNGGSDVTWNDGFAFNDTDSTLFLPQRQQRSLGIFTLPSLTGEIKEIVVDPGTYAGAIGFN